LVQSTKRVVAAAKFLVVATKNLSVVPNIGAVTNDFFRDFPPQGRILQLLKAV